MVHVKLADHVLHLQVDQVVEAPVDQVAEVQVERQCVQVESQYVEVDKYGHVVHRVVYWMEMRDV